MGFFGPQSAIGNRNGYDAHGNIRKTRTRPKARKPNSETHEDRELLVFAIMTLWRADLPWHALAAGEDTSAEWVPNAMIVWGSPSDALTKMSTARSYRTAMHRVFNVKPGAPHFDRALLWMKLVTPASIMVIAHNLIACRFDLENQQMWMGIMFGLMDMYVRKSDVSDF